MCAGRPGKDNDRTSSVLLVWRSQEQKGAWVTGLWEACFWATWRAVHPQFPQLQWLIDNCLLTSVTCSCWRAERRKLAGPAEARGAGKKPSSLPVRLAAWRRKARARCQHQGSPYRAPSVPDKSLFQLALRKQNRGLPPAHLLCGQGMACLATLFPHRKQAAGCLVWGLSEFCWQTLMCWLRSQVINLTAHGALHTGQGHDVPRASPSATCCSPVTFAGLLASAAWLGVRGLPASLLPSIGWCFLCEEAA